MTNTVISYVAFWLFPLLIAYAAASDLFSMTIANWISAVLVAGFFVLSPLVGLSMEAMAMHVGVALAVLAVGFGCFAMGWIGGGDAKFAAVVALWLGAAHVVQFLVVATLFGGVLTLLLLNLRSWPLPAAIHRQAWLARLHSAGSGVPYGIALAGAALVVYPDTIWVGLVAG